MWDIHRSWWLDLINRAENIYIRVHSKKISPSTYRKPPKHYQGSLWTNMLPNGSLHRLIHLGMWEKQLPTEEKGSAKVKTKVPQRGPGTHWMAPWHCMAAQGPWPMYWAANGPGVNHWVTSDTDQTRAKESAQGPGPTWKRPRLPWLIWYC